MWIKTQNTSPPPDTKVLGWDKKRGFTICHWFERDDFPNGQMWTVNNSSGGIGTPIEVKRPEWWHILPIPPL